MPLSFSSLFEGLSESQVQCLAPAFSEKQTGKGQLLYQEGEIGDRVYILKGGAVELLTSVDGEYELPIKIIRSRGGCFGTSVLVPPYTYSLSAKCAEDATLLEIMREDLEKVYAEDSVMECTIYKNVARHLLGRLRETRKELKIHFKTLFQSMQM